MNELTNNSHYDGYCGLSNFKEVEVGGKAKTMFTEFLVPLDPGLGWVTTQPCGGHLVQRELKA